MAHQNDGRPGRGVVGADLAEGLAAGRAIVDLLEIGAEQFAFPAGGAAALQGAKAGGFQIDVRMLAHAPNIVPDRGVSARADCPATSLRIPQNAVTVAQKARKAWGFGAAL